MLRYLLVSTGNGVLFGVLDALIHANPLGARLNEVYKPIARPTVNAVAGIVIDLAYGFIMAGIFLLLYPSLPGGSGVLKGLSYGVLAWFFRVVMQAASSGVMFRVPLATVLYTLATGLAEMLILGVLYGLILQP